MAESPADASHRSRQVADRDMPLRSVLFTDLYELTMAQAYQAEAMDATAVFELFFRSLPAERNYIVAAGLDDVLDYLEHFQTTDDDIAYLQSQGQFRDDFLKRLRRLRFTGDVYAVPEGTVVFPGEPLVQVVAPMIEAQLVETLVLNQVHFQSVIASKAARVVLAAQGRTVVDFGSRRAHGAESAMKVARVSYLVGAVGTSNVLAGKVYGIPTFGTMAHSYIQAHDQEDDALAAFARLYPHTTLLVDTYESLVGVDKVIALRDRLGEDFSVRAVRLDSGDLGALAKETRARFDAASMHQVEIFVSSSMDEYTITELLAAGAPIDTFGVGTKLAVSEDAPSLDMAYKLVEYAGQGRTKLSTEKTIWPGRKQVFRTRESNCMAGDVIGRADEQLPGEPLLQLVIEAGRVRSRPTLAESRAHAAGQLASLPPHLRALESAKPPYPVRISRWMEADLHTLQQQLEGHGGGS